MERSAREHDCYLRDNLFFCIYNIAGFYHH